ncbi:MAG: response regulator [Gemmatirosa sp.]
MDRRPASPRVLITTNDRDARHICDLSLRHAGYDVVAVDDPDRVLDEMRRVAPALIVTTHPTRTSTGRSVTEAIRADAAFDATPILSLASWVRPDELSRARSAGVSESIPMPVPLDRLTDAVRRLLAQSPPTGASTGAGPRADGGAPSAL